jgi:hypothetical protein
LARRSPVKRQEVPPSPLRVYSADLRAHSTARHQRSAALKHHVSMPALGRRSHHARRLQRAGPRVSAKTVATAPCPPDSPQQRTRGAAQLRALQWARRALGAVAVEERVCALALALRARARQPAAAQVLRRATRRCCHAAAVGAAPVAACTSSRCCYTTACAASARAFAVVAARSCSGGAGTGHACRWLLLPSQPPARVLRRSRERASAQPWLARMRAPALQLRACCARLRHR